MAELTIRQEHRFSSVCKPRFLVHLPAQPHYGPCIRWDVVKNRLAMTRLRFSYGKAAEIMHEIILDGATASTNWGQTLSAPSDWTSSKGNRQTLWRTKTMIFLPTR